MGILEMIFFLFTVISAFVTANAQQGFGLERNGPKVARGTNLDLLSGLDELLAIQQSEAAGQKPNQEYNYIKYNPLF